MWERDVAQWLERGALPMSLPAVQFRIPLGVGFSEEYHVFSSQYWDIISMLCPWARHFTLTCFTWLRCKWVPGQRWQCERLFPCAEMAASAVCSKKGIEMVHEWTGPVTRGNMCEAHRALYVRYSSPLLFYMISIFQITRSKKLYD